MRLVHFLNDQKDQTTSPCSFISPDHRFTYLIFRSMDCHSATRRCVIVDILIPERIDQRPIWENEKRWMTCWSTRGIGRTNEQAKFFTVMTTCTPNSPQDTTEENRIAIAIEQKDTPTSGCDASTATNAHLGLLVPAIDQKNYFHSTTPSMECASGRTSPTLSDTNISEIMYGPSIPQSFDPMRNADRSFFSPRKQRTNVHKTEDDQSAGERSSEIKRGWKRWICGEGLSGRIARYLVLIAMLNVLPSIAFAVSTYSEIICRAYCEVFFKYIETHYRLDWRHHRMVSSTLPQEANFTWNSSEKVSCWQSCV